MKHLIISLVACVALSSCMYLLPEGRAVERLRKQREEKQALYNAQQNKLSAQAALSPRQVKRTASGGLSTVPSSRTTDSELEKLRRNLQKKESELRLLEQELYLSH